MLGEIFNTVNSPKSDIFTGPAGHLIGYDKKSEIARYSQGRLCNKIAPLCYKLCDFFRANLHRFTQLQRRKPL